MNKTLKVITTAFLLFSGVNFIHAEKSITVSSPNNQIIITVEITPAGRLSYNVKSGDVQVLDTSPLGITIDSVDLGNNARITSQAIHSVINETYPIFGNHTMAHNHANEAMVTLEASGKAYHLFVRAYNDGVAIRYSIPGESNYINSESTSWNLPANTTKVAWSDFSQCYEGLSHVSSLTQVPQRKPIMGPITFEVAGHYLSISEADCQTFSDMSFIREGNLLKANFPFAQQGWEIKKRIENGSSPLDGTYRGESVSPWRTTIIAKNLTELINSDLLTNLCPAPSTGSDYSWVQPGRCLWQWWSIGSPFYEDQQDWFDAAVKLNWEYYLIDDGWRNWRKEGKDQWELLAEVIQYGNSVGVKSIVWVDSKEMREPDKRRKYLEKIKALGAAGIKIDFIPDATSDVMQWYMGTTHDCSELKLLLNFHGSVKPTGLSRTYPMDITREAVRGNEFHMTRYHRVAPLEHDVCLPFTRLLAGAADITPVILNPKELSSQKFTWAHQFAQSIVFLSPLMHFTDHYSFYLENPLFDLFQKIPTTWDETRVLSCTSMGEVVAFARRKGDTWWIAVLNGATEREIHISFDFLKNKAQATLIYDDSALHTSIERREQTVDNDDTLTVKLIPGGGFVAVVSAGTTP